MKWEVMLPYRKTIIVDDEKKLKLDEAIKQSKGKMINIAGSWFDSKSIKGIFPIEDKKDSAEMIANDLHIQHIQEEFYAFCARWAKAIPEEKAKREMNMRVIPFWKLQGGKREDKFMLFLYCWIKWWFKKNPKYPQCPLWFWGQFIRLFYPRKRWNHIANIIQRNDVEIEKWVKYKN